MSEPEKAAVQLRAGEVASEAVAESAVRPYRNAVIGGAVAQVVMFAGIGVVFAFAWSWITAGLVLAVGVLLSAALTRWASGQRTVIPAGLGRLDRVSRGLIMVGGAILVVAAAVLAPPIGLSLSGAGPGGLLIGILGVILTVPRLVFGFLLGKGHP